jgi:hypothetical protein
MSVLAEKIVVKVDKSFNFSIQKYNPDNFHDYMKSSLTHDTFILPKTAESLFGSISTVRSLLCDKNIPLEDIHYKIKSLNPSDTLYVVNKETKNVEAYYSGLTLDNFYKLEINYNLYRYIVDNNHFLEDVLLEMDSEGNKSIKPNLDCYSIPIVINNDAGIYLHNDHAIVIYPGVHINLYRILSNLALSNFPSLYFPRNKGKKPDFNTIGRIIYERLVKDYE